MMSSSGTSSIVMSATGPAASTSWATTTMSSLETRSVKEPSAPRVVYPNLDFQDSSKAVSLGTKRTIFLRLSEPDSSRSRAPS